MRTLRSSALAFVICAMVAGCRPTLFQLSEKPNYSMLAAKKTQVTPWLRSDTLIEYLIQQPVVNNRIHEYPNIRFEPGDVVWVRAGGCVQTGGFHKTWKAYVNPAGPESHRLYFGTIWIPSVTVGAEPIRSVLDVPLRIPRLLPSPLTRDDLFLRLGYVDDERGYSDNGYSRWDTGFPDQCDGDEDHEDVAWVNVRIARNTASARNAATSSAIDGLRLGAARDNVGIFDISTDSLDANGLPLNPTWTGSRFREGRHIDGEDTRPFPQECGVFRVKTITSLWATYAVGLDRDSILPTCARQLGRITLDDANRPPYNITCVSTNLANEFHGHINWIPATYRGRAFFEDHSEDNDFDMDLYTPFEPSRVDTLRTRAGFGTGAADTHRPGQTRANSSVLHMEFNAAETTDHFDKEYDRWWGSFSSNSALEDSIAFNGNSVEYKGLRGDGLESVVTGLIGLDATHELFTELHPVFAIALHTKSKASADNEWQLMLRNSGDEGSCSQDQHYLDLAHNRYTFALPWPRTDSGVPVRDVVAQVTEVHLWATGKSGHLVDVLKSQSDAKQIGYEAPRVVRNEAIYLTVAMPRPEEHAVVYGSVHIKWTPVGSSPSNNTILEAIKVRRDIPKDPESAESSEGVISWIWSHVRRVFHLIAPRQTRAIPLGLITPPRGSE